MSQKLPRKLQIQINRIKREKRIDAAMWRLGKYWNGKWWKKGQPKS